MLKEDELTKILNTLWGFVPHKVLVISIENQIFEEIEHSNYITTSYLAKKLKWEEYTLEIFLNILIKMKLIYKKDDSFFLTKLCKKWFLKSSKQYLGFFVKRSSLLENSYNSFLDYSKFGKQYQIWK